MMRLHLRTKERIMTPRVPKVRAAGGRKPLAGQKIAVIASRNELGEVVNS